MRSQFDGLHAVQEQRRERNKRYRDRAPHIFIYVFYLFSVIALATKGREKGQEENLQECSGVFAIVGCFSHMPILV